MLVFMSKEQFTIQFIRDHDTHDVAFDDGQTVTLISEPTWDRFADSFSMLEHPGTYILSPELITTAGMTPGEEAKVHAVIAERVEEAQEISLEHPGSTILLGTATVDSNLPKPRNSTVFIKNGELIGQTHKMPPYNKGEFDFFYQSTAPGSTMRPDPNTQPIICSDLLYHAVEERQYDGIGLPYADSIKDTASTILVNACWAPPMAEGWAQAPESHAESTLRSICSQLFARYTQLNTVIMCDRAPEIIGHGQPLNFAAYRNQP